MSEISTIVAEMRERAGKGTARAVRRQGRVPAVVYGDKQEPQLLSVELRNLMRELHRGSFTSKLFDIEVGGKKVRVLPRDVQVHPVTDRPVHVDFLRVAADARIRVMVPTSFVNEADSPGLKRGGVLNVVRHEIEFYCRADSIPATIVIDLAGRDIGDSIHISHIALPPGVAPVIADRDFTVATVSAPTVVKEPEVVAAAAAVPAEGEAAAAPGGAAPGAAPAEGDKKKAGS